MKNYDVISAPEDIPTKLYVDSLASGITRSISTISTSATAGSAAKTDYTYFCSAALTLTMPTAVGNTNVYTVKKTGTGNVTVSTTASQTIDGAASFLISPQWMAITLVSNGSNWMVV